MKYTEMNRLQLEKAYGEELSSFEALKAEKLSLNMARGKPNGYQLDISCDMLTALASGKDCVTPSGLDVRNYGELAGVPEARDMFAELCGVGRENVIMHGNSSLTAMYDTCARFMLFGAYEGSVPWSKQGEISFLCPSPGYDRHFAICEAFGIRMIPVDMTPAGPDMDAVERLTASDKSVKGMWCVPKYSNPDGVTYSDETVRRIAALRPAADDFRVFWDNAYIVHDLTDTPDTLINIFDLTRGTPNEDMVYMFVSTSKITFPGAGVAAVVSSGKNISYTLKRLAAQSISYDKLNQWRHVVYFKNADGIRAHMKRHAALLAPKFRSVLSAFSSGLGGLGIASWNEPKGGYFISLDVMDGTAGRVYELCREAGVTLTKAGATYPYGKDSRDRNLRIAPSYPSAEELDKAIGVLCVCVRLAALEKLLRS